MRHIQQSAVSSKELRPTVLVTGGMGNIGKYAVRELLKLDFQVISVDLEDRRAELLDLLDEHGLTLQQAHFTFVHGDIRDRTVIGGVLTAHPDLTGIVHLAAISTLDMCLRDEDECLEINAEGTRIMMDEVRLHYSPSSKNDRPWVVFTSSNEVYGASCHSGRPCDEATPPDPLNLYGSSKLKGEEYLRAGAANLRGSLILRLSSVYGGMYDLSGRLLPRLSVSAMNDGTIELMEGDFVFDFVHINDVVASILHGIRLLMDRPEFVDHVLVCSGQDSRADEALSWTQYIGRGHSPVTRVPYDERFPRNFVCDNRKMKTLLGHTPTIPDLQEGLAVYMRALYRKDLHSLQELFLKGCARAAELELASLDGCRVFVTSLTGQSFSHLSARGPRNQKDVGTGVTLKRLEEDGKQTFVLNFEENGEPVTFDGSLAVFRAWPHGPSGGYLLTVDTRDGVGAVLDASLNIVSGNVTDAAPVSVWPYWCPAKADGGARLPTSVFEPIFSLLRGLIPPEAGLPRIGDRPIACARLADAITGVQQRIEACTAVLLEGTFNKTMISPSYSDKLGAYPYAYRPLCDSHCGLVSGCIKSRDCRCVRPQCWQRAEPPTQMASHLGRESRRHGTLHLQNGTYAASQNLRPSDTRAVQVVRSVPFADLLTSASRPFYSDWRPPKVHVLDVDFFSLVEEVSDEAATSFKAIFCFCADHLLYTGVKQLGIPLKESEAVFVPYYEGWLMHFRGKNDSQQAALIQQLMEKVKDASTGDKNLPTVIPMSHDFGGTLQFLFDMRKARFDPQFFQQHSSLKDSVVLSPFGDYNTRGYLPHKDVVIPPASCLTPLLLEHFSRDEQVKPILERKNVLAFFASIDTRTGSAARAAVAAGSLFPRILNRTLLRPAEGIEYLAALNDSVFCPHLFGTSGWATRLQDAIYCGCIPVLTSDVTHPPFYDVLDWSKFSVFVDWRHLEELEDVLLSYDPEALAEKHAYLLRVRKAFLYDESAMLEEYEGVRQGPFFMTLLSLKLRLATRYPIR